MQSGLRDLVDARGGFARTRELLALGATERMLTAAVRTGELIRARNGWYTTRDAEDAEFLAVRLGGVLTGMSALRWLGCWEWGPEGPLHVAVRRGDARLRRPRPGVRRPRVPRRDPHVRVHWVDAVPRSGSAQTLADIDDALVRVALDESLETAVVAFDWALHHGVIDEIEVRALLRRLPRRLHLIERLIDGASESPVESIARVRLAQGGHLVETQVEGLSPGPIDLVVDGCIALEIDGRRHHAERFEADRSKDLALTVAGKHVIRASANAVRDAWPTVARAVRCALVERARLVPTLETQEQALRRLRGRPRRPGRCAPVPEFPTPDRRLGHPGRASPRTTRRHAEGAWICLSGISLETGLIPPPVDESGIGPRARRWHPT